MSLEENVKLWRERFYGRPDVVGYKDSFFDPKINEVVVMYTPVYRDKYMSKEMRKEITEPSELYMPMDDTWAMNHIKGVEEVLVYLLQLDGTVKFAAVDFDTEYNFDDVRRCKTVIENFGIKCAIARSTKKGHHVYMFFDDYIEAKYVTCFLSVVYQLCGFSARVVADGIAFPETFPKTIQVRSKVATSYGIKPPMHGGGMQKNMNCWVDDSDEPIGGSGLSPDQWDYFRNIPGNDVEAFKQMTVEHEIPIKEFRMSETRGLVEQMSYKNAAPYEAPSDGDFSLIISGCNMLYKFWNMNPADIPHRGRVAMVSWAMQTNNGLKMLRDKWGHSSKSEYHIQNSIETHQQPWTCVACQDHQFCTKGIDPKYSSGEEKNLDGSVVTDYCFKRVPPKSTVNGQVVINPDKLPEDQWPLPSPVRLRKKFVYVTLDDIKKEIGDLSKNDADLASKITDIKVKASKLKDKKKIKEINDFLKERKLIAVKDLKELEKEATEMIKLETVQSLEADSNILVVNGTRYILMENGGYGILDVDKDGNTTCSEISNFQIILQKDIQLHTMMDGRMRELKGYVNCCGKKTQFHIDMEGWNQPSKLANSISASAGTNAIFRTMNLDKIKEAAGIFGMRTLSTDNIYEDHGWDDKFKPSVYRSQNWNITQDGIVSGEDHVCFKRSPYAHELGLIKLNREEFSSIIHVLKNDLVNLQDKMITMTVIAHSLQAAIHNVYIPFNDAPVLWIQGLTGAGKTTIARMGQTFYGPFERLVSITGTINSLEMFTMTFKDALLVVDDYKENMYPKARTDMIRFIQKTYDRIGRTRLKADLSQRQDAYCRGLVMITSEDRPSSEASVLSRCMYIEAPQVSCDSQDGKISFNKILDNNDMFCGITPKFVHYMMVNYPDPSAIKSRFNEIQEELIAPIRGTNNSNRVSQNLAANYFTWSLFCEFMVHEGVMTGEEHTNFVEDHWQNVQSIRDKMVCVLGQEVASAVFLDTLRGLVLSGECKIEGFTENTENNRYSKVIGFVDPALPKEVYLIPKVCIGMVKSAVASTGSGISHGTEAIGKQLVQQGIITKWEKERTQIRKSWKGGRPYLWCMDLAMTGLGSVDADDYSEDPHMEEAVIQEKEVEGLGVERVRPD